MQRRITLILVLSLFLSIPSGFSLAEQKDFEDINNHWSKEWVNLLVEEEITSGYPDNTFRPDEAITVEEFITFTIKSLQTVDPTKYMLMAYGDHWSDTYVGTAIEFNIITWDEFDNYRRVIKREEMASIIVNAYSQINIIAQSNIKGEIASVIKDYNEISDYYVDSVLTAWKEGFITGKGDNIFDPLGTATRGEASVLLVKLLDDEKRTPYFTNKPSSIVIYDDWDGPNIVEKEIEIYAPMNKENKYVTEFFKIHSYLEENDNQEYPFFQATYNPFIEALYTTFWKNSNLSELDAWGLAEHQEMHFSFDMKSFDRGANPYNIVVWKRSDMYEDFANYSIYFKEKYGAVLSNIFIYFFETDSEEALRVFYDVLDYNDGGTSGWVTYNFNGREFNIIGGTGLSLYFNTKNE